MESQYSVVCFGEILWDILPSGEEAGGAPMNVAYHLTKHGINTAMISRIGNDERGKKLLELLQQQNVVTDYIQSDNQHQTGVVYARPGANHEMTYEIVQPVAWDFIEWNEDMQKIVEAAGFFVHGSLGARSEISRNTLLSLLECAQKRVFDINIRPPHFDKNLALQLLHGVHILKLNEAELNLLAGWYGDYNSLIDQLKKVQDELDIPLIIVTRGEHGAMINAQGKIFEHPGYKVLVADTVGSGDAFLAGFLCQILNGAEVQQALNFACASGSLIASYAGACPDYKTAEIRKMLI
ncbi:carbohydrate kinase [Chitinophagaceae bacterium LB-8]|uniref:Carbohydrate kinase n=1 Tax=Paraflavisolibacter caeni TaxID=2982496 RepID=A0A9X3B6E3_9BACT|nr:carbohydrate kinase [Paraflavisolibacter caeni]MCU7547910.1 carbohydrate kinase [Paraflavisolibacter caeni]